MAGFCSGFYRNSLKQVGQTIICKPNLVQPLFLYSLWPKNGFYIFKCNRKNIRIKLHVALKLYEIPVSGSIVKFIRTQPHALRFYPWLVTCSSNRVEPLCCDEDCTAAKPKYLLSGSLEKKIDNLWTRTLKTRRKYPEKEPTIHTSRCFSSFTLKTRDSRSRRSLLTGDSQSEMTICQLELNM